MPFKLGKKAPKHNPKTLRFDKFVSPELPAPPTKAYYEYKIDPAAIGMYLNDELGDCVVAGIAHHLMLITAHAGKMVVPTNADVLAFYEKYGGYDPAHPDQTDNGMAMTDAYHAWQTDGFCGHKIRGWASLDPADILRQNQGLWLFMGVGLGVQLPASAQTQFADGKHWEIAQDDGGIEGGHAILESGYGYMGRNVETWGKGDQKCSTAWKAKYCDESYVVLTDDLISAATGKAPSGFNIDALQEALKEIAA